MGELRMVQRMLFEKVNQTREHAKAVMTDPTRVATLPMRKLRVQVRSQQVDENASVLDATPCLVPAARRDHAHLVDCQVPDEREPYVPRSVRMRGSSCAVPNSGASTVSLSPMTFCAFEIQWMRNQKRPMDRFEQDRVICLRDSWMRTLLGLPCGRRKIKPDRTKVMMAMRRDKVPQSPQIR